MVKRSTVLLMIALTTLSAGAFAYDFWGATLSTADYNSTYKNQLAFTNVGSNDIQGVGGSYKYTRVDGVWSMANSAASPGTGYPIHRAFDAMGLFFKAEEDVARFMIFTGMPSTGTTASDLGYGSREFGPGDLKIDVGTDNYGVGLRKGGLVWGSGSSSPYFQIHKATNGAAETTDTRLQGTVTPNGTGYDGRIEKNALWEHVNNPALPNNDPRAFAFFVNGSGAPQGDTAAISYYDTGITMDAGAYHVYAYEAAVPWDALGVTGDNYDFTASWRPDCGNDLISARFIGTKEKTPPPVPEPYSILLAVSGLLGIGMARRRR